MSVSRIALNRNRRGEPKFDKNCSHHSLVIFGSALHLGRCNGSHAGRMISFQWFPSVSKVQLPLECPADKSLLPRLALAPSRSSHSARHVIRFGQMSDVKWAKGAINWGWVDKVEGRLAITKCAEFPECFNTLKMLLCTAEPCSNTISVCEIAFSRWRSVVHVNIWPSQRIAVSMCASHTPCVELPGARFEHTIPLESMKQIYEDQLCSFFRHTILHDNQRWMIHKLSKEV